MRRRRSDRRLGGLLLVALSWGCATERPALDLSPPDWSARIERLGVDPTTVPTPMEATPAIRELAWRVGGSGTPREQLDRLHLALLDPGRYTFEYDGLATLTARETFERRRGNCVSFTNLFIALGRSLGIPVQAGLLVRRAQSAREGDLVVNYSHMVAVLPERRNVAAIFDFYRHKEETRGAVVLIDDLAVAAIAASNDAVQALKGGDLTRARERAETAVKLSPALPDVWGNLGLVRWRTGDREGAFQAFNAGLQLDAGRPAILHNIAGLYLEAGRPDDARAALAAADHGVASPYFLVAYGDIELGRGNPKEALRLYRKAHRQDPDLAEPLLAMAKAQKALGDLAGSEKTLAKAARLKRP